jgi:hypothetical protein
MRLVRAGPRAGAAGAALVEEEARFDRALALLLARVAEAALALQRLTAPGAPKVVEKGQYWVLAPRWWRWPSFRALQHCSARRCSCLRSSSLADRGQPCETARPGSQRCSGRRGAPSAARGPPRPARRDAIAYHSRMGLTQYLAIAIGVLATIASVCNLAKLTHKDDRMTRTGRAVLVALVGAVGCVIAQQWIDVDAKAARRRSRTPRMRRFNSAWLRKRRQSPS